MQFSRGNNNFLLLFQVPTFQINWKVFQSSILKMLLKSQNYLIYVEYTLLLDIFFSANFII